MTRVAGSYEVPSASWSMRATELARLAGSAVQPQPQATSRPGQPSDADVRDLAYDVQMLAAAVEEWAWDASRLARDAKVTAEHVLVITPRPEMAVHHQRFCVRTVPLSPWAPLLAG